MQWKLLLGLPVPHPQASTRIAQDTEKNRTVAGYAEVHVGAGSQDDDGSPDSSLLGKPCSLPESHSKGSSLTGAHKGIFSLCMPFLPTPHQGRDCI